MSNPACISPLERGRTLSEQVMPGLEAALAEKYDAYLPGFSSWQIETVYGGIYARDGLDTKTRQIATIAGLACLSGQALPQLKIHIRAALDMGVSPREISETILQMVLYAGFPAAINAMNAAIEVFEMQGAGDE